MAFRSLFPALAALLLLAAPAQAEQVLRVPLLYEPTALDPHLIDGLIDFRICNDLFEPLVTLDPVGGLMPGAAESWSDSPDHLTWSFTLRADERWSDGTPVTSADFLYSLRRIVDPKTAASYASALLNGVPVNSAQSFYPSASTMAEIYWGPCSTGTFGEWLNLPARYLGLQFQDAANQSHYGWAEVSTTAYIDQDGHLHAATMLFGFAYETVPNQEILTGQQAGAP